MTYAMISGSRPDRLLKASFAFLWLAFLLFPVAHLGIGGGIPMYWSEMAIGCSLLAFILYNPGQAQERVSAILRGESKFFIFAGLFLAGIVFAYGLNPHSFSDWGEIKSFYIVPILSLIIILVHAETKERIEFLASGWLLGLAAASLAGVTAYMAGWLSYDGRLTSLYLSPNYFAMLVAPGILISSHFFATQAGHRRLMILFLGGIILFALWATHSYAAWVAVLIASMGGIFLCRSSREPRRYIIPLLFIIIMVLGGLFFQERGTEKWQSLVSGDERSSFASRIMIWRAALKITKDSFPIGIGTGRFQTVYLENQTNFPTYLEWAVPTPHNLYLHFLLEGGALTLIGWFGCVFVVMRRGIQNLRRDPRNRLLVLGLTLTVFYLIYGLVDTPYMKNDLALAVWGSLGLCLAALRIKA